jgi:hypothetical protein
MAGRSSPLLAPLVIAAMGLAPLALLMDGAPDSPSTETAPSPDRAAVVVSTSAPPAAEPTEVVISTPAPAIPRLSDEVARVLASQGFSAEEAVDGIPPNVVALLNERGVVLTIAVEGGE